MDNRKYIAIKPTTLSTGVNVGDTTCIPSQIKDRLGNTISAMTSFGTKGFGVISPDTDKEEQFVFTGLSSGTVSGVSAVTMQDPYTETSGWLKEHAAGEPIILYTNSPAFYNEFANVQNDNTYVGTQTFPETAMPRISAAHTYGVGEEEFIATKRYVDGVVTGGAADANTTTKGLVEEATQAEIAAGTAAGGTSARLFTNPSTLAAHIQSGAWLSGSTAGTADAITATLTPTLTALSHNMIIALHTTNANNAGCTLNVDGLGAKAVYKYAGGTAVAVEANDMKANYHHIFLYDSDTTVWLLINPVNGTLTSAVQTLVQNNITDLTDGGSTTLHTHSELPGYQNIALGSNLSGLISSTNVAVQFAFDPSYEYAYLATKVSAATTVDIGKFLMNPTARTAYSTGTSTSLGSTSTGKGCGICVTATYVWVVTGNSAGTDILITRYAKDMTGVQTMTISGTAYTGNIRSVTGTDSILYVKSATTGTQMLQYTISGTTATRGADITLNNAVETIPVLFDGTNFFQQLTTTFKKWAVGGGADTSESRAMGDSGSSLTNAQEDSTRAIVGIENVNTNELAVALFNWKNETTADRGFVELIRVEKI